MVDFLAENDEFIYHSNRESLSLGEVVESATTIRNFYDGPYPNKKKITFIKNYFKIYLQNTVNKRLMIFELVNLEDMRKSNYKVYLEDEEIIEFVNLSHNIS